MVDSDTPPKLPPDATPEERFIAWALWESGQSISAGGPPWRSVEEVERAQAAWKKKTEAETPTGARGLGWVVAGLGAFWAGVMLFTRRRKD